MNDGTDLTAGSDPPAPAPGSGTPNRAEDARPMAPPAGETVARSAPDTLPNAAPSAASKDAPDATPNALPNAPSNAASTPASQVASPASSEEVGGLDSQALQEAMMAMPTVETIEPGYEMTGAVVALSGDDVFVELDAKSQGLLSRSQFGKKEPVEVGRRVDVVVDRFDSDAGLYILFRKGAIQRATWTNLAVGSLVEGRVTGLIKGGLEVDLKGIRAFMPGSHADLTPMKDVSTLLNEVVKCEVLELDRRSKNVIVSRRKWLEKDRARAKEELLKELAVGQVRQGVVESLVAYGAFVDLGGVTGLAHISDLTWGNVEKVADVLSVGQAIEVKVLKIDRERGRISLSMKHATPDPWLHVADRFEVGTMLKVRITRLADFGAFAELEPGVEGLIPISEMSWSRISKTGDAVALGDMIDAKVLRVEPKRRRLALSMKQAQADPWANVLESFTEKSIVEGTITRLADFGAFLELAPGVEGLIHISQLADKHVKSCSEVVQPGETVKARVLGVDQDNRRISLSIKAVNAPQGSEPGMADASVDQVAKPRKKRKKPLRGGLSSHYDW